MTSATDTGKPPKKPRNADDRAERLAAALRANLRRRKERERGRGAADRKNSASGKDQDR